MTTLRAIRLPVLLLLGACGNPVATESGDRPDFQIQPPTQLPCLTCAPSIPTFGRPFAGEFPAVNLFDHGATVDSRSTFYWGESVPIRVFGGQPLLIEGHRGYDWKMNEGTPVLAAAGGRVVEALNGNPNATCPFPAAQLTQQRRVTIEHTLQGGTVVRTIYDHLSSISVANDQVVLEGEQIGRSGQTGCARGPHLHFEVKRVNSNGSTPSIDPYGWDDRNAADPWKTAAGGAESIMLWRSGQVPSTLLTAFQGIGSGANSGITSVAWMGPRDTQRPKNEVVVLTFAGTATQVFRVAAIRGDRSGLNHSFATMPEIRATRPRMYFNTGTGQNNDSTVYLGRTTPVWDNQLNDCARIVFANGNEVKFNLGNGCP